MELTLQPDTRRFIDDQVKAGRFPTPEAVVEAAIAQWQNDDLDAETIAAINEAEAQADRGEGIDLATFRAGFQDRISGR